MSHAGFLKMEITPTETLQGGSVDTDHRGWSELQSWNFGDGRSPSIGGITGGGAGKVDLHKITFTKQMDGSSREILLAFVQKKQFSRVIIHYVGSHSGENMWWEFHSGEIEDIDNRSGGDDGYGPGPTEKITLSFKSAESHFGSPNQRPANMSAIGDGARRFADGIAALARHLARLHHKKP